MRVVVALGGNALAPADDRDAHDACVALAADALAEIARDHELVVTHGNGPQIGALALLQDDVDVAPLDVLGAETEGMLGYALELALASRLPAAPFATLLTMVEVAPDDAAFATPTKPIGRRYTEARARELASQRGWDVAPDGPGWRRVVASPQPLRILEEPAIAALLAQHCTVICAGGGGIPIARDARRGWRGVEAVVDKDATSALLAERLHADRLVLATAVDAVYEDWNTSRARPIGHADVASLRAQSFAPGSMAPKVAAACTFAEHTGNVAVVGALADLGALVRGERGTVVTPAVAPRPGVRV